MEEIVKLIEQHPELKEAYDKLVALKGELSLDDIKAFLKEHGVDLDGIGELTDDMLDNITGGTSLGQYFKKAAEKAKGVLNSQAGQNLIGNVTGKSSSLLGDFLNKDGK